ncbi:hypothetical protein ASF88_12645 [Leifsonia sp. Leaf336]|uniref:hypothetical protein n=1 Tax=Leifsonia sp. Leaf336 TaxID=1736341 RepID=UPI0006FAFF62|nr:hypothetical protein [Leifsonia sp. Leaf336]KQR52385.1 hypothetical protein ASF88_12645 [Leifsonia sp. Leaf336]
MDYHEIDETLAQVYLEDSFVLSITVTPGRVVFDMEVVLLPPHEMYSAPADGERYHYKRGEVVFSSVKSLTWSGQGVPPSTDPVDGSIDFGNIDSMTAEGSTYFLEGDWGRMQISSPVPPEVVLAHASE